MIELFETKERRLKDEREIRNIFMKYGDEAVPELRRRARNRSLSQRDRKHWKRMLSKARAYQRNHPELSASALR